MLPPPDGSANGFNYEDGTLAADAVHERKCAANNHAAGTFGEDEMPEGVPCPEVTDTPKERHEHFKALLDQGWTQTTTQRWFADPLLTIGRDEGSGQDENAWWMGHGDAGHDMCPQDDDPDSRHCTKDRTLRTVFTHDHFAPSSIQQHGFYSALLIEPENTKWLYR